MLRAEHISFFLKKTCLAWFDLYPYIYAIVMQIVSKTIKLRSKLFLEMDNKKYYYFLLVLGSYEV